MADKKISQLTELTSADNDDAFAIVDDDASETKKITYGNVVSPLQSSLAITDPKVTTLQSSLAITDPKVTTLQSSMAATDASLTSHTGDSSDPHGATLTQTNINGSGIASYNIVHITGDHTTSAAAYCVGVIMASTATPPTASNFQQGTIFVQYTA